MLLLVYRNEILVYVAIHLELWDFNLLFNEIECCTGNGHTLVCIAMASHVFPTFFRYHLYFQIYIYIYIQILEFSWCFLSDTL